MRKRWRWIALIILMVICLLTAVLTALSRSRKVSQRKREANYESALQKYRSDLNSAATRGDVERYLQSRNVQFNQMCCVDREKSAYSDLVLIGKEDAPWYCSENNVYIAFHFGASEGPEFRPPTREGIDSLKAITVHHQIGGCL